MATLNARGHEILDQTPVELPVRVRRPGPSVAELVRAELLRAKAAQLDIVQSDQDILDETSDYTYDGDDATGELLAPSPYEVPVDVPDRLIAPPKTAPSTQTVPDVSQDVPPSPAE